MVVKNISLNEKLCEPIEILTKDSLISKEPAIIEEEFNDYFVNIGENYANSIVKDKTCTFQTVRNNNTFFPSPANENEINAVVNSLKDHKATVYDGIKSEILKRIVIHLSKPFVVKIFEKIDE